MSNNTNLSHRIISSGDASARLANGELQLDLSEATLRFSNGRQSGPMLAQFTPAGQFIHSIDAQFMPTWLYTLQPGGVQVIEGEISLRMQMPRFNGGYQYLHQLAVSTQPDESIPVLLLGWVPQAGQVLPVGVGRLVLEQGVYWAESDGVVAYETLDLFGIAHVDESQRVLLNEYLADLARLNGESEVSESSKQQRRERLLQELRSALR